MANRTAEPKGGNLETAMAVFQSGLAAYRKWEASDGSVSATVSIADEFLSMLVDRGVTLEDLIGIMRTIAPMVELFLGGQKKPKGRGGRPKGTGRRRGMPSDQPLPMTETAGTTAGD